MQRIPVRSPDVSPSASPASDCDLENHKTGHDLMLIYRHWKQLGDRRVQETVVRNMFFLIFR